METLNIESLINDLALILMLGAFATIIFKTLKQPVVLGYIVAGFIASPHFSFFPSVAVEANIEFWAQIGIIVLLFSLGLEFSFKKLLAVGGSAIVTALIIVLGMMGLGFVVGKVLGFKAVDSIFLGGMISMSSTTIIIKALTDLNMRQRRFVPMIFAVLIVEDLFAVLMMVILSSVATGQNVASGEMLASILRLSFFLLIWFTVGIFLLPTMFKRVRRIISDEMLLVVSMGLCFLMAVFSVKSGFSLALGAFVMGSILAGTIEAERIERLVGPVKDLFGAVFFISVGMMVDPAIIANNAGTIALLSVVVIVGMIVFGTFGMVATGQPLKMAVQSGFTLTQIGEFSFIIASLGMTLGVLEDNIYPIIVAVSVITTFTTPFFIKQADPCYGLLERVLPSTWTRLLNGYSAQATQSEAAESHRMWNTIIRRYALRVLLYSVVALGIVYLSRSELRVLLMRWLGPTTGAWTGVVVTIVALSPFLYAITRPSIKRHEREVIESEMGRVSVVPIVVMVIMGLLISMAFVMAVLYRYAVLSSQMSLLLGIAVVLMIALLFAPFYKKHVAQLEHRFIGNVNVRENRRTGRGHNLVSDLHLAYMRVGNDCPFVGKRLKNANIRQDYGVNLVNIQRGGRYYPVPSGEMRIFPGDMLGVIGTDEQIQQMLPLVEAGEEPQPTAVGDTRFTHFTIGEQSPLVGKQLVNARLREDYESLLVAVQRGDDNYENPTPDFEFQPGDVLWIVGDPKRLATLI
ncbi:MAG: cation:proton antiporter [Muribaculaceae bacterium]|nr:cation:proton antiporter [Muribaculaceae bacterium]